MTCYLCVSLKDVFPDVASGDRTASAQASQQAISLAVTLGFSLLGGTIVGKLYVLLLSYSGK